MEDPSQPSSDSVGYLELIRTNVQFRRLWIGTLVSMLGDWFNTIALYKLIATLTGSPLALGAVFLSKMLPWALVSPLAGYLVDRFNRRRLMIVADLLRAVVVLGFLFVHKVEHIPWVYVLIMLQIVLGSVFNPAKNASVPNITHPRELLTANALSSATWSVMLALGAGLGGLATEWFGTDAVFILDSGTYLVSAYFIYRTRIPQHTEPASQSGVSHAYTQILDGWRYMIHYPQIGRIALAKTTWALGGGGMVYMLTLLGESIMPAAQATGIGLLFCIRGIGTGVGPILARNLFENRKTWPALLGSCVVISGLFYTTVGTNAALIWIVIAIFSAHAASGATWVLSTVLLQERSEDRFRGRVFASDWLLVLLTDSVSILSASLLLEFQILTLNAAFTLFAAIQILCGLAWLLFITPSEKRMLQ